MNKNIKYIFSLYLIVVSFAFAFEDPLVWTAQFLKHYEKPLNVYYLTGSPASYIMYQESKELFHLETRFADLAYQRSYDPRATQLYRADFSAFRQINEKSFFSATISYDEYNQRDVFASMEKDFYDDYFSMIDSTLGNTKYYGPQLRIMYNFKLTDHLFFGIEGNYGVERSLKDTFPRTITIMRNSGYRAGLDYRTQSLTIGVHGRYYDDQTYYEAVKSYSDVKTKTYMGYNVFYNELARSSVKKKRIRNGVEYGGHIGFSPGTNVSGNFSISGLQRLSRAERTGSTIKPRGLWQRKGIHMLGNLNIYPDGLIAGRIYADYLHYTDWGKSLISNALVIENEEMYSRFGTMLVYKPSMIQEAYVGAEAGKVEYDYTEYVSPFQNIRSGLEWKLYTGANMYLSSKTRLIFDLAYEHEIPKFYWNTDSFDNTSIIINLEQSFTFGYIGLNIEYIQKKPANNVETIDILSCGLSFRQK